MESFELAVIAAGLTQPVVDKMAHALGWPTSYAIARGRAKRGTKWANPYRNYYCGSPEDPDWKVARTLGLAEECKGSSLPGCLWKVTAKGRAVIRIRLLAAQLSYHLARARPEKHPGSDSQGASDDRK